MVVGVVLPALRCAAKSLFGAREESLPWGRLQKPGKGRYVKCWLGAAGDATKPRKNGAHCSLADKTLDPC